MNKKVIVLNEQTTVFFNEARQKYLKEDNTRKLTDDLVLREALKKYLGVKK